MANKILSDINNEFADTSKQEWIEKATIDLKGKTLESLNWKISDDIVQSAYYDASDIPSIDHKILTSHDPDWQVGERYVVTNYKETNQQLLEDLQHGLNAPKLQFTATPSFEEFKSLFANVGVEHIYCHFESDDGELLLHWEALLKERKVTAPAYFGLKNPIASLAKSLHIDARTFYKGTTEVGNELKNALTAAKALFYESNHKALIAKQMAFTFYADNSYLLTIAKLRAFKLLWVQLLEEEGIAPVLPFIYVEFAPEAYGEDEQDNLINATSMAMGAVLGGANHLIVRPTSETASAERLARNIQLILKHESGLHKVADPAQGSFYIESLTAKLVNWCR